MFEMRLDKVMGGVSGTQIGKEVEKNENTNLFKEKLESAAKRKDEEGLREAAREFESYFIGVMLKQMRKSVIDGGLIEKSEARKQFESMLDDEYAKEMSKGDGIGLGTAIFEAMKQAYGA